MKITLTDADGSEYDITESVAFMYDAIVTSLDWGSGFLDLEETLHIASVGVLAGYQVPEVIPFDDYPEPRKMDFYDSTGFQSEKFDAVHKAWADGYGARAREAILSRLAKFEMDEEN